MTTISLISGGDQNTAIKSNTSNDTFGTYMLEMGKNGIF